MKPLLVLLGIFLIGIIIKSLSKREGLTTLWVARIAMSTMLLFTAAAHFAYAEGMTAMLPSSIPFRLNLVYLTGILEILGALGLMINSFSRIAGICLIIFLLLVLPANIYAALNHIDPITGVRNGPGLYYLFFRVPLQLFFILWIYLSAVKRNMATSALEAQNQNHIKMKHLKSILLAIALTTTFCSSSQITDTYAITVHITGVRNTNGVIRVFLFNSEEGFLTKTYKEVSTEVKSKDMVAVLFDELPAGEYAINVYHDQNNNGELDTNWMRIPKESYGFSNNVRGKMGPPKYEEVKFSITTNYEAITINIK